MTRLLREVEAGADGADDALMAAVYADLRQLASARMRGESGPRTLQATALVHEAWLRLNPSGSGFVDRKHFFGAAARVMRQILVERHRRAHRTKRGGDAPPGDGLDAVALPDGFAPGAALDLVALDEALDALAAHDERMSQIVHLRYFAGLSVADTAEALDVSPRTVKREWSVARAWLFERMS
ncbi:MAG: ECF-type sigma factor [Planctomycetota bacterium]